MILEAFADYLHSADPKAPATDILARWLWERLSTPPLNNVDRVLHCEILVGIERNTKNRSLNHQSLMSNATESSRRGREQDTKTIIFKGSSDSGKRLLKSLYEYCLSYEQQKWARFVHSLKASDFNQWVK